MSYNPQTELLKPQPFDWTDDFDEEDDDGMVPVAGKFDLPPEQLDILKPDWFDWAEEFDEAPVANVDAPDTETGGLLVDDTPPEEYDDAECDASPDLSLCIQREVHNEFAYRNYLMAKDPDESSIHHFNWLGRPVLEYSNTPAAVSLLYLASDPKVPSQRDNLRVESILKRATVFIDPIIMLPETEQATNDPTDLSTRGCDLVKHATGRVHKFYSPHGTWMEDHREREDETMLDGGHVQQYLLPNVIASNSFVQHSQLLSRSQREQERIERLSASRACDWNVLRPKLRNKHYKPSPLRHATEGITSALETVMEEAVESLPDVTDGESGFTTRKEVVDNQVILNEILKQPGRRQDKAKPEKIPFEWKGFQRERW